MIIRMRSHFLAYFLAFFYLNTPCWGQAPITLANVYQPGIDLSLYWISEKYDGVRAFWDGERLLSRQGNEFQAPKWFIAQLPDTQLDGELWIDHQSFEQVVSTVKKFKPIDQEWREVKFMVFDLPDHDGVFSDRYQKLQKMISKIDQPHIQLVAQTPTTTHEDLMQQLQHVTEAGGEGLMLRRHDQPYRSGRSDDLLKVKPYQDAEGEVIAHLSGKGRHKGKLGALLIELDNGKQFKIGTGFTDQQRENPPRIGSLITFRYQGLTRNGLPRFARFLRVRSDTDALSE